MIALLFILAMDPSPASAPVERNMSMQDVIVRVDNFDPLLRVRAIERTRMEINLRRAKWNQVSGNIGLNAQDILEANDLGPIPKYQNGTDKNGNPVRVAIQPLYAHQLAANLTAQIAYPLYAGGGIQGAIDAAAARARASDADWHAVQRDLRRAALSAYAQLIATNQQVVVATDALERGQNLVDVASRRKNAGIGTEADVARAKLNLLREQEDLEQRRGDEALAQAAMRALLLLDRDTNVHPTDDISAIARYGNNGPQLERPELVSFREQTRAADYDRKVAFSGYLPQLALFANATYGNGSFVFYNGVPFDTSGANSYLGTFSGALAAGAQLSWTFFDFFITRDKVAVAATQRDELAEQLADRQRQIYREAEEAKARETQARRRVDALGGGKEAASTAIRLAKARYESGNAILTEVLDAEIEAIGIEERQIQAAYDLATSHLDRLHADGNAL